MNIITQNQRYLPHDLSTRYHAVLLYRNPNFTVKDVIRRYKISKASLMRWNKRFDGTKSSLKDKSHRPHTPNKKAHTDKEIQTISTLIRRNPSISLMELFGKLKHHYGYNRHCVSLFRVLRKMNFFLPAEVKVKKYIPKPYDTPLQVGTKMQLDVKYVPSQCCSNKALGRFYQYTIIDEASRERFIYAYDEHSSTATVDFIKRALKYFGYIPKIIQTDHGGEFTHNSKTNRIHPMDILCNQLGIIHQLIRPRTPRHNGKVERSHRNDNRRFYQFLKFYSLDDLKYQMSAYLKRANRIPMQVLAYKTPKEHRKYLEELYGLDCIRKLKKEIF